MGKTSKKSATKVVAATPVATDDSSDEETPVQKASASAPAAEKGDATAAKKKSESEDESNSDDEEPPKAAASLKRTSADAAKAKMKSESEDDSDDGSSEESEHEEPQKKKIKAQEPAKIQKTVSKKSSSSSDDDSSEEEDSSGEEDEKPVKTPVRKAHKLLEVDMNLDKYLDLYNNVSREELKKIRDCSSSYSNFKIRAKGLHQKREREKIHGRWSLRSGPLIHVLSIRVQQDGAEPLSIYGRIHVSFCDPIYGKKVEYELYKRDHNVAELLDTSGTLSLNGPEYMCNPDDAYIPLTSSSINLELFHGDENVFAQKCFSLEDTEVEDYEQIKSVFMPCQKGSLTLQYIAIPFGISCRIEVKFHNRISEKRDFVNVNGKIHAQYSNTHGNYALEECVLFDKRASEFGRVEFDKKSMQLSRCWIAMPTYSSLIISLDLSEFETGQKIVKDTVRFPAQRGWISGGAIVLDDISIEVRVSWFPPTPMRPHKGLDRVQHDKCSSIPRGIRTEGTDIDEDEEETDTDEEEDESSHSPQGICIEEMDTDEEEDESSDDESSSNNDLPRSLHPHESKPCPSPAVEIFSVFIGREKLQAVQVYGSIQILCGDSEICSVFKRGAEDSLCLSEHRKSIPISDGSRVYEEFESLEMKIDLKDVEGRLAIKGYVEWSAHSLQQWFYRDKLLCSLIQGQNGFAAMHYCIFEDAVGANMKVFFNLKTESADVHPKIYGSLIVQYNCFDYSLKYNKDWYRSTLFWKGQDDSVQLNADGTVPLSRSMVVVPSYSKLIISADLFSGESLLCAKVIEIGIGRGRKTIETNDFVLRVELDWCEIQ